MVSRQRETAQTFRAVRVTAGVAVTACVVALAAAAAPARVSANVVLHPAARAGLPLRMAVQAPPPGQAPQPRPGPGAPPPQQPPPGPTAGVPVPSTTEGYAYNPEGRRDPFVSLLARGSDLRGPANRPPGLAGLLVSEVSVKGIVKGPKGILAMITGPDKRTYIIHPNDRLFDGTVKAITEDAVIFSQDVNDPLSLVKQREVRKPLRTGQEGK